MGYCANTSPKALISADTASVSLTRWPQPSTVDLAKPWDGRHPPKRLMTCYLAFNQPMLRRLLEPKQYTSAHFQGLLQEQGITCSMSRTGEVWDNSAMESFFSSLKTERTARKVYRTRDQARADVFDYIERFYNPRRRHSTLGYLSPVQFEEAQKA